ncbi:DUF4142 domain-containing protein [Pedobacter nyackensis]|uniref:DUF4142 domain-containing protein n=1 Tax=Pedobacter nyackensis TaxID=475255 RepID=UPI0029300E29|nr:DUF4142 domain-containing protein [Pedobacter nyackensis]
MKNRTLSLLILAAGGLFFQRCQPADRNAKLGDSLVVDRTIVDTAEMTGRAKLENEIQTVMFIEKVALSSLMGDTLGKLAIEKSTNRGVSAFGKLMEQDQKRISAALKVLSSAKRLNLPMELPVKEQEQIRQMREMEPAYFEKLYLKMMIEYHNKNIELFKGAGNSPDTAVSNFAHKFLPVLEANREKALKLY